ncbi:MAG: ankyrin repeat domain-containing protein, partial [Treponema sp.]|nr:ankyrin repeat domain-containing protein [Treponema sp.]
VNAKDKRGAPALMYAEENDATDVIELLKAAGAETEK